MNRELLMMMACAQNLQSGMYAGWYGYYYFIPPKVVRLRS
jgi:hypothetical protein